SRPRTTVPQIPPRPIGARSWATTWSGARSAGLAIFSGLSDEQLRAKREMYSTVGGFLSGHLRQLADLRIAPSSVVGCPRNSAFQFRVPWIDLPCVTHSGVQ